MWALDTEPGFKMTAASAHLCGLEVAGSAVGEGCTLSQETKMTSENSKLSSTPTQVGLVATDGD